MWFHGVCDRLLTTFTTWEKRYDLGDVYSDRPYLTSSGTTIRVPVKRLSLLPFTRRELEYLVDILGQRDPNGYLAKDFKKILDTFDSNALAPASRPEGACRFIRLAFYKEDVTRVRELLESERRGDLAIEKQAEQARKEGKGLWQ